MYIYPTISMPKIPYDNIIKYILIVSSRVGIPLPFLEGTPLSGYTPLSEGNKKIYPLFLRAI